MMATLTVSPAYQASFIHSRPLVSSPLASSASTTAVRPFPKRNASFPSSRPLRPFPSINKSQGSKPSTKLIQPPENHKQQFVLNLTQAELGRQD